MGQVDVVIYRICIQSETTTEFSALPVSKSILTRPEKHLQLSWAAHLDGYLSPIGSMSVSGFVIHLGSQSNEREGERETCERVVFRIKGKSHSITILYSVTSQGRARNPLTMMMEPASSNNHQEEAAAAVCTSA